MNTITTVTLITTMTGVDARRLLNADISSSEMPHDMNTAGRLIMPWITVPRPAA